MGSTQRTAAIIHLDRLAANLQNIRARVGPEREIIAVVKADAYGHGAAGVYPTLRKQGIRSYAVAFWQEGAALREAGARTERILLLADTPDGELDRLLEYDLTPTIFTVETALKLNALAAAAGTVRPVQIKIDTGMHRLGFPAGQGAVEPVKRIAAMENLRIAGAFTHFSRADEPACGATERELAALLDTVALLRGAGVDIPSVHACNSPGLLLWPESYLDAVRPGDVLYGLCPVEERYWRGQGLRQVMEWVSRVAMVKTLGPGEPVGYGATFVTERVTRLATVPVGFADGYSRGLSNRGKVRIRGRYAPIVGRICMDQFMADVTDIPGVERGDTVTLLDEDLPAWEMAEMLGTNVDEIACCVGKRVPRIYTEGETETT